VLPRAGRLLVFSSSEENPHHFARVTAGRRLAMSMWYTCDAAREFESFLDGKPHEH